MCVCVCVCVCQYNITRHIILLTLFFIGPKTHSCPDCTATFDSKARLRKHSQVHRRGKYQIVSILLYVYGCTCVSVCLYMCILFYILSDYVCFGDIDI